MTEACRSLPSDQPLTPDFGRVLHGDGRPDGIDRDRVVRSYKAAGAVLLRDFGLDLEGFEALTKQYTEDFITIGTGHKKSVGSDASTQTLFCFQEKPVPLHAELGYSPLRPDILWLYCMIPANDAGETTLCDGTQVWSGLRPSTREALEANRIVYAYPHAPRSALEIFLGEPADGRALERGSSRTDGLDISPNDDGSFDVEYRASAVVSPRHLGKARSFSNSLIIESRSTRFEDGTPISDDLRSEFEQLAGACSFGHKWQKGDVLMVDNARFMHGRAPYSDPNRMVVSRIGNQAF